MTAIAYLRISDVATLLDCSEHTVRRRIACGDLPVVRLSARMVRVRSTDVDKLMRDRLTVASTADTPCAAGPVYAPGSRWWTS